MTSPMAATDKLLGDIFEPRSPHQNLIRKAFINHWHRAKLGGMELPIHHKGNSRENEAFRHGCIPKINIVSDPRTPARQRHAAANLHYSLFAKFQPVSPPLPEVKACRF